MFNFFKSTLPDASFDCHTASHLHKINQEINRFKKAQILLQTTDKNIIMGLAVGSAGWVGAYLPTLVSVSIGGFCFATYHASQRMKHFTLYKEALTNLIQIYQWAMGKESDQHWEKLAMKEIQELILTLGPVTYSKTLCTWDADALKPRGMQRIISERRDDLPMGFENKLAQFATGIQTVGWAFRLYGEDGNDDWFGFIKTKMGKIMTNIAAQIMSTSQNERGSLSL